MAVKRIVYMAAGSARRFGANKLLCPLEGRPLFLHGLQALAPAAQRPGCTLTVVSRYAPVLAAARALGARAVDCPESEKGLSYTIRAGLDAAGPSAPGDFWLFAAADQPWLTTASVERLLDAARPGVRAACLAWGEQLGSPVLIGAGCESALRALQGDEGGKRALARLGVDCLPVQAGEERELWDIDTPGQLAAGGQAPACQRGAKPV